MCARPAGNAANPQPRQPTIPDSANLLLSRTAMKLCGQISVELNVGDYIEAADHQKRLEDILKLVRDAYPDATLAMRERRQRKAMPLTRAAPHSAATGALNRYADD